MKKLLRRLFAPKSTTEIIIVSGLPRSGTSMMMKMLEAGGIPPLTDQERTPDIDNPKGYYEFERVKKLKDGDTFWLKTAQGKSVKVISALLQHLPPDYQYRVILMRRNLDEVIASQKRMLTHRQEEETDLSDEALSSLFTRHLAQVEGWLQQQPHITFMSVNYNQLLANPTTEVQALAAAFPQPLNQAAMIAVIDQQLYRQRH
jgi:hypothetical protein